MTGFVLTIFANTKGFQELHNYRPQTKFAKVVFTRVCHSVHGRSPGQYPGRRLRGLAGGFCRPIPRGEVEGSGQAGSSGPYRGARLRGLAGGGSPGPGPGGPGQGCVYPSMH